MLQGCSTVWICPSLASALVSSSFATSAKETPSSVHFLQHVSVCKVPSRADCPYKQAGKHACRAAIARGRRSRIYIHRPEPAGREGRRGETTGKRRTIALQKLAATSNWRYLSVQIKAPSQHFYTSPPHSQKQVICTTIPSQQPEEEEVVVLLNKGRYNLSMPQVRIRQLKK
jgi:hypothetical protein